MKTNKRKILCHSRRRIRTPKFLSNCSLSQILYIASYKKRINDLSRNNRLLTTALQESRIESAFQNNLLQSYAKDANQILFARIKLNDMAKNLAKFATDLEEVRNCLDIDGPTEYNFFQKKNFSNERISKVPDMSCIDEMPELSENEIASSENSDILQSDSKENLDFVNSDVEMTPVAYADDIELQEKRSNGANRKSVTSEEDINLEYVTQKRLTRSSGKIFLCKNDSFPLKELDIHTNDVAPLVMRQKDPIETNKTETLKRSFLANEIESDSENTGITIKKNCDESMDISSNDCSSKKSNKNEHIKKNIISDQDLNLNHSGFLCENNDVSKKNVSLDQDNLEIDSIQEKDKSYVNDELSPKKDSQKLSEGLLTPSSVCHGVQLPEISEFDDEIQNVGSLTFCEPNDSEDEIQNVSALAFCEPDDNEEEIQNAAMLTSCKPNDGEKSKNVDGITFREPSHSEDEFKNTTSPHIRSSRSKKPVKYTDYFSPDEYDISPPKLSAEKGKAKKTVKLFSSKKDKSDEMISTDEGVVSENPESDYSVYNLDVSNSKIIAKKTKKKAKHKKASDDFPKPLFHKCSVTKLKAGKLKFSKCETPSELNAANKVPEKPLQNYCASPGGILKKVPSRTTQTFENNIDGVESGNDMENNLEQIVLQTPKSASKKVSFAPLDLICSFVRTSVSKTIADNKKVRRTSKSFLDFKLFDEEEEDNEEPTSPPVNIDNVSDSAGVQKSNSPSPDTKLCTVTLHSIHKFQNDAPSKSPVSEQTQLLSNENDKHIKNSSGTPNSPKSSKRLSLKGNKITHTAAPQPVSSLTIKEADILFLESPISVLKRPKRVSLFKEPSDNYLEEHINSDHLVLDKKNSLKESTHVNENSLPTLNVAIKTSSYSKYENEIHSKVSIRKNKKSNPETSSEHLSVLVDSTNLTDGNISRRRSKQVCYKEPSLTKKLRRE